MISKMDKLFGSRTRVSILSLMELSSGKEFYIKEVSDALGLSYGLVHRELQNLKYLGLVSERHKGKLRHFKINKLSPIYSEVRGLILKTEGLANVIGILLNRIKGISYALVFGSIAKGEDIESSDVDILIVGDADEGRIVEAAGKAERRLGREVNYILWSEREFSRKIRENNPLLSDIMKGPVIMIVGDEDGFRKAAKGKDGRKNRSQ